VLTVNPTPPQWQLHYLHVN